MTTDEQKVCYYTERLRVLQRDARKDGLVIGAGISRGRRTPYKLTVIMLPWARNSTRPLDAPGVQVGENQPIVQRSTEDGESERI